MELERCPNCNEPTVVHGRFISVNAKHGDGFVLARPRLFKRVPFVPYDNWRVRACASRGHVWSSLDPARLREVMLKQGDEIDRQHLDEIDHGPLRDPPDTEPARAAGEKVWEIDVLVRSGRWDEAVRKYRELRGVAWDQSHKDLKKWRSMPRWEKIALFGWVSKKKGPVDELA